MFGLYIHIPYCLQKCHYCDFTTFEMTHEIKMADYVELLVSELEAKAPFIPDRNLTSIYYGGGTPSVLPVELLEFIQQKIKKLGFQASEETEITVEINPGTVDAKKLDHYRGLGVNRFSVGVQTFNDSALSKTGRKHSADDSRATLRLLQNAKLNYSFDLLFGLPQQTLEDLTGDLLQLLDWAPPHVSLYNLTVPQSHFMNQGRASDDVQAEMFDLIANQLKHIQVYRYELSNFAKDGHESKHNRLYWSDRGYWGIGVSAHSYMPTYEGAEWGIRFWNTSSARIYREQIENYRVSPPTELLSGFKANQFERLSIYESMTDFCHTFLRTVSGLSIRHFEQKFGSDHGLDLQMRIDELTQKGLVEAFESGGSYRLTSRGWPLANQVFLALTFVQDKPPKKLTPN